MPKQQFHFAAISKITLEHETGMTSSVLKQTDIRFEISNNLDRKVYFDSHGLPTKEAIKPITNALVMGLIANVRTGAANGWMTDYEHMKYIIDQLQRAFVAQTNEPEAGIMEY